MLCSLFALLTQEKRRHRKKRTTKRSTDTDGSSSGRSGPSPVTAPNCNEGKGSSGRGEASAMPQKQGLNGAGQDSLMAQEGGQQGQPPIAWKKQQLAQILEQHYAQQQQPSRNGQLLTQQGSTSASSGNEDSVSERS